MRTCCCCLSLQTGTKIIAWTQILISLSIITAVGKFYTLHGRPSWAILLLVFLGIFFLLHVCLLIGASKENGLLVAIWFGVNFALLMLGGFLAILEFFAVGNLRVFLGRLMTIPIYMYCLFIAHSYIGELEKPSELDDDEEYKEVVTFAKNHVPKQ